jgi:peroxiredoxin
VVTQQPVSPIEAAFLQVRSSDLSLKERLAAVADAARTHKPAYAEAVDEFAERLRQVQVGAEAPAVGERMPSFVLPDHDGKLVSLDEILKGGPAVIAFHRGHWCPFCRLSMIALARIEEQLKPAQVVAISTETQRYTRMMREQTGAMFPVLTDMDGVYAMSLSIAVLLDDKLACMISEAGWDVPLYQGGKEWLLPIPAVFIVKQDGTIAARHIDPDYRQRMESDELLRCVQAVTGGLR